MKTDEVEIGADGDEVAAAVRAAEEAAALRDRDGGPSDNGIVLDIKNLEGSSELMSRAIETLKESAHIDIGDFPIPSRPGAFGRLEALVKKAVWGLLRFYTYRLFSQQVEYNAQVVAVLEAMLRSQQELEERPGALSR